MDEIESLSDYVTIDTEISSTAIKRKLENIKSRIIYEHALIALCQILKHPLVESFTLIRNKKITNLTGLDSIMLINTFDASHIVLPEKKIYGQTIVTDKGLYLLPKLKKDFKSLTDKEQKHLINYIEKQLAKCRGCTIGVSWNGTVYQNLVNYFSKEEITLNNYQNFVSHILGDKKRTSLIEQVALNSELKTISNVLKKSIL